MPTQTTYAKAQANLANLCDQVTADRDVVVIRRRGADDVALVAASELSGLLETAHLLRSPKNAKRLMSAMKRADSRRGNVETISQLRQEIGLERKAQRGRASNQRITKSLGTLIGTNQR